MILISYLPGQVHQVRQRQLVHLRGLKKLSKVGEIFKRLLIQCDHAPGPQYSSFDHVVSCRIVVFTRATLTSLFTCQVGQTYKGWRDF